MMEFFGGIFALDEVLYAPFVTHADNLVAATPTGTPTYEILSADLSTVLASGNCNQVGSETGQYYPGATLSSGTFASGEKYTARVSYVISGTTRVKFCHFNIS